MDSVFLSLIFFLGGFTQGLTGFGSSLVAVPLASLFMDFTLLTPLGTMHGIVITSFLSWQLRQKLDPAKLWPLIIGSLPGVVIGVLILRQADQKLMKILLGLLVSGYSLYRMTSDSSRARKAISRAWALPAGFLAGLISAAFSAGGPPAIIYTSLAGWGKDDIKATLSGFFLVSGLVTAIGHLLAGLYTPGLLLRFLATVPFIFLGTYAGSRCYARIDQRLYLRILLASLLATGLMLLAMARQA